MAGTSAAPGETSPEEETPVDPAPENPTPQPPAPPQPAAIRYVAIGDSFTEGVGDERSDGSVRGWADLVAQGIADAVGAPIEYANLAIRGRLLAPIIAEQLEPALALGPTLVSFNGGGNDMLRPRTDLAWIGAETEQALRRIRETGAEPLLLAGPNPTAGLPRGERVRLKGDALVGLARGIAGRLDIRFVDNWNDAELPQRQYWAPDRLHLAPVGHHRVAANVLRTLGYPVPNDWATDARPIAPPTRREQLAYTREHVVPWMQRRITGRSSGDGRSAKHPEWVRVEPRAG
ncbi:SGNH/GDSL hydrolase family protein [Leucobacter sp. GX24907]